MKAWKAATAASGSCGQRLLHPDAEGGEEEAAVDALGVHDRQPGVAVAVLGADRLEVAEQGGHVLRVGIPTSEVLVEAARLGHGVERGIGDEPVDLAGHQESLAPIDLGPLHGPSGHLRVEVAGEGVGGLVVVVVGVEVVKSIVMVHLGCHWSGSSMPSTRSALVRRNLGHTSSLKGDVAHFGHDPLE